MDEINYYNTTKTGYNETASKLKCGGNTYLSKTTKEMEIIKDKILCVFSHQENFEYKMISILSKKDEDDDCYFTSQGTRYRYCKPFNSAEFNIVEDLKEYEK